MRNVATDPILTIEGREQSLVDPSLPDAGIPPAVGVASYQVFRASRDATELSDGRGWTYHHHVDMAVWKGKLYVGWNSCERDEDVWPSRELFSTSDDGAHWEPPRELFPQGVSTPLRIYFFHAPNGRMLAIAGMRFSTDKTDEDLKNGLVVREINADHSLGEVFALQTPLGANAKQPTFEASKDNAFVAACRALLADTVYLEQQDRGKLLGDRAMKWHDAKNWPGGKVPGDNEKWVSGKAFSFYRRPDNALVGISKMGWTTISRDDGKTWDMPSVPPTLVTGKAKVWAQKTADGRFALVYNPSTSQRFPLVVVAGEDGQNFRDMRIVQGELPIQRYAGEDRSVGPQYIRGVSMWSDDASRKAIDGDKVMWLVYSMSKEDIWVSAVPLPVQPGESGCVDDDFSKFKSGSLAFGWNLYSPKWAPIFVSSDALRLEDRDPYDHACATRVFALSKRIAVTIELSIESIGHDDFEIELLGQFGDARSVRIAFRRDNSIAMCDATEDVNCGIWQPAKRLKLVLTADATTGEFSIAIDGADALRGISGRTIEAFQRLAIRTSRHRGIGGKRPVTPGTDKPVDPTIANIFRVSVTT